MGSEERQGVVYNLKHMLVRESLTERVIYEQRPAGDEGAMVNSRERALQTEGEPVQRPRGRGMHSVFKAQGGSVRSISLGQDERERGARSFMVFVSSCKERAF